MASEPFSIDRVSQLARIDVSKDESASVQQQITQILQFIDVLDELNLDGVQPFFGSDFVDEQCEYSPQRADQTKNSTPRETILGNAPNHDGEFYKVPPVF